MNSRTLLLFCQNFPFFESDVSENVILLINIQGVTDHSCIEQPLELQIKLLVNY